VSEDKQQTSGIRRIIAAVALALLPVLGLAALWWLEENQSTVNNPESVTIIAGTALPVPTAPAGMAETIVRPTIGLATPWEVEGGPAYVQELPETPAPTPVPIVIQGPPPDSLFRPSDQISFYWKWPQALDDGNRFVVYITANGERVLVGAVTEMNLGTGYQIQTMLGDVIGKSGTYGWQVVLESQDGGVIIAQSEERPITLLEG
jgi:hypothetical protein